MPDEEVRAGQVVRLREIEPSLLGLRLRLLRHDGRLLQSEVAGWAGLSSAFLSMIETGQRRPSMEVLERLATALGVGVDELLREETAEAPAAGAGHALAVAAAVSLWFRRPADAGAYARMVEAVRAWEAHGLRRAVQG